MKQQITDDHISYLTNESLKKKKCLINDNLEQFQTEMSLGFQTCDHKYSQNGTLSCIKCGLTNKI